MSHTTRADNRVFKQCWDRWIESEFTVNGEEELRDLPRLWQFQVIHLIFSCTLFHRVFAAAICCLGGPYRKHEVIACSDSKQPSPINYNEHISQTELVCCTTKNSLWKHICIFPHHVAEALWHHSQCNNMTELSQMNCSNDSLIRAQCLISVHPYQCLTSFRLMWWEIQLPLNHHGPSASHWRMSRLTAGAVAKRRSTKPEPCWDAPDAYHAINPGFLLCMQQVCVRSR